MLMWCRTIPSSKWTGWIISNAACGMASTGKGISDVQAKASAVCEAIERYSGQRTGAEVTVAASFGEMRKRFGMDVIHPNDVMLYSERQLRERNAWNARKSRFNIVPRELDESAQIDWTPVWSLTHNRHKYLPTQLVYFQSKAGPACDAFYCVGCSNGNASGNNLEEAVLQGFCELVERDAVALWWYPRSRKPALLLDKASRSPIYSISLKTTRILAGKPGRSISPATLASLFSSPFRGFAPDRKNASCLVLAVISMRALPCSVPLRK